MNIIYKNWYLKGLYVNFTFNLVFFGNDEQKYIGICYLPTFNHLNNYHIIKGFDVVVFRLRDLV